MAERCFRRNFCRFLFGSLLLFVSDSSSIAAGPMSLKQVRFAFPALSAVYLPIWVAKEAGIFQKSGLDVAVNYVAGNNKLTAAMIGGSIEIGVGGSASIDANARKASDLVFVAAIAQRAIASLYARPEVTSVGNLRGKIIATVGKATLTDDAARIILLQNRISPDEVKFVYTNSVSANLTALVSGNVAAAILTAPGTLSARKAGMIEIASAAATDYPYLHGSIVVLRPYLKSDRETLKLFLRGLVDGIRESKANANRAVDIMAKYLKGSQETLLESYKTFVPFFPDYPEVPLQAIENVASLHGLSLDAGDAERMVDNSIIREVANEPGKNRRNDTQER
jgi:NitT/TauT family transport system substrate-binding protein